MPKRQLVIYDMFCNDLVQYKGNWLMSCQVSSIDIDMRSKSEKLMIMEVFKQVLSSFDTNVQLTLKKFPLDFSSDVFKVKSNILSMTNQNLKEYAKGYAEFLDDVSKGKLDKINYFTIRTDRRCSYQQAQSYLGGVFNQIKRMFAGINMEVHQIIGEALSKLYTVPEFIKEEEDYFIYGNEYKRTYIILDYPSGAYPNFLKPILNFPHPVEITEHLNPYPKDRVINFLEKSIAKLQSTLVLQEQVGTASAETAARKDDAKGLLDRIVTGRDTIISTSVYVTITAQSYEQLNNISYEIEGALRQLQVAYRRSIKDNNQAMICALPLCDNRLASESYTFDTASLSRLVPFTSQDYSVGGVLYGINEELAELITFDIFDMPNYNKIILGKSGFGKSLFSKLEIGRQLSNGIQSIVVDHNQEYQKICKAWGGQYVEEGKKPDWNNHLIVFGGDKTKALDVILNHLHSSPLRERLVTVEEFQTILREDKALVLDLVQTIRKTFSSPTLITQNVKELLRSDEGQMILDNCSMKFFMHQGENDMEAIEELYDFSKEEKFYMKSCQRGYGYLVTDLFRTKFKVQYSDREHDLITTNPRDKVGGKS
jgi:hypothetical protein